MQTIDQALSESVDAVTPHALDLVHNAKRDLRLDLDMAIKILSRAVSGLRKVDFAQLLEVLIHCGSYDEEWN